MPEHPASPCSSPDFPDIPSSCINRSAYNAQPSTYPDVPASNRWYLDSWSDIRHRCRDLEMVARHPLVVRNRNLSPQRERPSSRPSGTKSFPAGKNPPTALCNTSLTHRPAERSTLRSSSPGPQCRNASPSISAIVVSCKFCIHSRNSSSPSIARFRIALQATPPPRRLTTPV